MANDRLHSGRNRSHCCNGRRRERPDPDAPKIDPGPWGGEGYCQLSEGWGVDGVTRGRCKYHGGKSLKGTAHPRFNKGEHSAYVPARYLEDFEEALADPMAQGEQTQHLAGLEAIWREAFRRLGGSESGEAWNLIGKATQKLSGLLRELRRAQARDDKDAAGDLLSEILGLIEDEVIPLSRRGVGEEAARRELIDLSVKRSRLLRVKQQGERTVPVEALAVLQAQFAYLVAKYIDDPRSRSSMVAELREKTLPGWAQAGLNPQRITDGSDDSGQKAN